MFPLYHKLGRWVCSKGSIKNIACVILVGIKPLTPAVLCGAVQPKLLTSETDVLLH